MAGYGVFCTKPFNVGDFLLEYRGKLMEAEEGEKILETSKSSFVYFFEGVSQCRKMMW